MAASMNMTVFWDISSCTAVEVDRRFRVAYCLYRRPDDGGSSHLWPSVYFNYGTWHYIPEGCHVQLPRSFPTNLFCLHSLPSSSIVATCSGRRNLLHFTILTIADKVCRLSGRKVHATDTDSLLTSYLTLYRVNVHCLRIVSILSRTTTGIHTYFKTSVMLLQATVLVSNQQLAVSR
jgi:hypothetical protein